MMRTYLLCALILTSTACSTARDNTSGQLPLVVVLSFDQYRGDFVTKFRSTAGSRGFQRMIREGAWYSRCLFGHASTLTGPGHATLLTGCYSHRTGIVGNDFCDRDLDTCLYCAEDETGEPSAFLLRTPTVGDVLNTVHPDSKVIGISLKDRAALLMAGKQADAVVFLDYDTGRYRTSNLYASPTWLPELNAQCSLDRYAGMVWNAEVTDSQNIAIDDQPWEAGLSSGRRTFPHVMSSADVATTVEDVTKSPFSLQSLMKAVLMIVKAESLGADGNPDLLVVGASMTDHLGHAFGAESREVQEMYLHADRAVELLIDSLDVLVGRNRYMLVVTSDHGVAPVPEQLLANRKPGEPAIDAGRIRYDACTMAVETALTDAFGKPPSQWVWKTHLPNLYLDHKAIAWTGKQTDSVVSVAVRAVQQVPGVGVVVKGNDLLGGTCPPNTSGDLCWAMLKAAAVDRTGDVVVYPKPYWIFGSNATTHGTPWEYDRWVPLLIIGGGVVQQKIESPVGPADVAPTLARLWNLDLGIIDGRPLPLEKGPTLRPAGSGR